MFGSKVTNPYEAVIAKATDEKQTDVNWDVLLTVWDKVNEDGETGARNCVAALQKRFVHRSANVHLFSLTLAGALVNNCGAPLHREISGKAFTQTLVRLINDRSTHESVKTAALKLIQEWVKEHPNDPNFDILVETYEQLKRQGQRFPSDQPEQTTSTRIDRSRTDEALRREEEELQRALEESAKLAGIGSSGSGGSANDYESKALPRQPSISHANEVEPPRLPQRVRALYDFAGGQSPEELPFVKGDVIRVIDSPYNDWWRGELRGKVGIFPRTYCEELPDAALPSTSSSQATEAEIEAELFAKSAQVDRLLQMMRTLSSRGENLAEDERVGELYNELMALRPKVVALIRQYESKGRELREMNDKFGRAKMTYEGMVYGQQPLPQHQAQNYQHPHQQQQQAGYGQDPRMHQQQHQQQLPYPAQQQQPLQNVVYPQQQEEERARREAEARAQREYEAQMVQYEKDMAVWKAAQEQAQQAQYHAVQGQPAPNQNPQYSQAPAQQAQESSPHPQSAIYEPPPAAASTQQWATTQSSTTQDPTQPVWDGSQWIYPQQQQQKHAPVVSTASISSPTHSAQAPLPQQYSHATNNASAPPPMASPPLTTSALPLTNQSYPAQPYPTSNPGDGSYPTPIPISTASPPPQQNQQQQQENLPSSGYPSTHAAQDGLLNRMNSLSMNNGPEPNPTTPSSTVSGLVPHQLYDPPMPSLSSPLASAPTGSQIPEQARNEATGGEGDDKAWQEYYRQKAEWDRQQASIQAAGGGGAVPTV